MEEPDWWEDLIESSDPDENNEIWRTVWWDHVKGICLYCGDAILRDEGTTTVHYGECETKLALYFNTLHPTGSD